MRRVQDLLHDVSVRHMRLVGPSELKGEMAGSQLRNFTRDKSPYRRRILASGARAASFSTVRGTVARALVPDTPVCCT